MIFGPPDYDSWISRYIADEADAVEREERRERDHEETEFVRWAEGELERLQAAVQPTNGQQEVL